jgi:hypothetical protein
MISMKIINEIALQTMICLKDNKLYVYTNARGHDFTEEDYKLVECFPVKADGRVDFSKRTEIYAKDLIRSY